MIALVFEASSGLSEAKVATKSLIVPVCFFCFFFISFARFRDNFRKLSRLKAYISKPKKGIGTVFTLTWAYNKDEKIS